MNVEIITKQINCVMTQGIASLQLSNALTALLFKTTIERFIRSKGEEYMTTYEPDGINILIGDGNDMVQTDINSHGLKDIVWCIIDDYQDYLVATLIMPNDY